MRRNFLEEKKLKLTSITDTNMLTISSESNLEACRQLWEQLIPNEQITDLWDVRECFHRNFERTLFFVVARDGKDIVGLLPLCYIKELDYYGYFPGETWQGKTWLEQNRLMVANPDVLRQMFKWLGDNNKHFHLRYLCRHLHMPEDLIREDEIGYFFYPNNYNYLMEDYYTDFSRKSIKTIRREVDRMYEKDLTICNNVSNAFDEMIKLNIERFGTTSYFSNNQFVASFRALKNYLEQKGLLRMTTVMMHDQVAAVDLGCLYKGQYTLLAGGTHSAYPGVAKVINCHHMQEACKHKYTLVDFLCGDFSWKKLFHLTPRPLYAISNLSM